MNLKDEAKGPQGKEENKQQGEGGNDGAVKVGLVFGHSILNEGTQRNLHKYITTKKLKICLITNTWEQVGTTDNAFTYILPEGFLSCNQVRGQRGGGNAIAFNTTDLTESTLTLGPPDPAPDFEYVAANLKHDTWDNPIIFINMFRTGSNEIEPFLEKLENLFNQAVIENKAVILTGNFNIPTSTPNVKKCKEFEKFLHRNNLKQCVKTATRGKNILDMVIIKEDENNPVCISDPIVDIDNHHLFNHIPVLFNIWRNLATQEEK